MPCERRATDMERITAMKITALSFCTFRNHTEPEG